MCFFWEKKLKLKKNGGVQLQMFSLLLLLLLTASLCFSLQAEIIGMKNKKFIDNFLACLCQQARERRR